MLFWFDRDKKGISIEDRVEKYINFISTTQTIDAAGI